MTREVLTGLRLSELAICARRCALRGLGHIPSPPTDQQTRYFARGQLFEKYVVEQFKAKYGPDDIETQRVINWGDGWEGHVDIYVKSERLIVEVVSTTGGNIDHKIRQAMLYLLHDDEATGAAVYTVNPSSLDDEQYFPVFLHEHDRAALVALVGQVQAALEGGELPACVHSNPSACRHAWCPFTDQAWEGWEAPQAVDLSDTPGLVSLVAEYYRLDKEYKESEAIRENRWQERNAAREALAEVLPPGAEVRAGPFTVKRTAVRGRETFAWGNAKKAGAIPPGLEEALAPFVKVGDSYSRIYLKRVSDDPLPSGFSDEVPF